MRRRPGMAGSSLIVMAAFVASKAVGLLRDRAIAYRFGTGPETDAYYAAFRVPDLLFTLIAGGALVSAFLPVFSDALARDDTDEGWRIASGVTNLVFLATAVLASGAALAASPIMDALAPGFPAATRTLAASLMRVILAGTLVFAVSGIQMGILNAYQHFLLPAIAPAMYNAGILFGALALAPRFGVRGLAYGVVLGAVLHLAVKVPALVRFGFQYVPRAGWGEPGVRLVLRLMGPRVIALATVQASFVVAVRLASDLAPGSVSAFQFGWVISQMPQTVLGTAIGIVAFPTLAELAARQRVGELRNTAVTALRAMLLLSIPGAAGMYMLAKPTIDLLLVTGSFGQEAAHATLGPLKMFSLGLVGHVTLEVVARMYYALKDTVTPLYIAAAAMALNVTLAVVLVGPLSVSGLALANTVAVTAEVLAAFWILRGRLGGAGGRRIADAGLRAAAATAVMVAAIVASLAAVPGAPASGILASAFAQGLVRLIIGGGAGAMAYAVAISALGLPEVRRVRAWATVALGARRPAAHTNVQE